ncbi:MAG: hypothetical protein WAO28_02405 [Candidatus Microsaccharimonas sp.]
MRLSRGLLLSALLLSALVVSVFSSESTYAAQITARSLTLVAGATDGGSKPGGVVNHKFDFTIPSTTAIGSVKFEYCTTASGTCTMPTGLVTTSATLNAGATGYASGTTLNNTTNGAPYITKTATNGSGVVSVQLNSITNPTTTNYTFFVRISTFVATNATGGAIDAGTVAASTATQVVLTGTMPESLIFCVGETISTTSGIPDCTTATAGAITFNQLFSPTDTATARSQFSASTNAASGYSVTVNGPTLTSGGNTIPAMATSGIGVRGTGQFGMNLKLNTTATSTVAVGLEVAVAADGTNFRGQAAAGYNTVDNFKFVSGDIIANSANGGAGPTNAQIFTASYIVNVAGNQASGTYTSTLTYICTATF